MAEGIVTGAVDEARPPIAHVDMDAFFASCEEARDPSLRGKPLIVGGDPRGGSGRGVVTAANYAARALGVHSAMPIGRAWRLAPKATFVPTDGSHYRDVSRKIFEALEGEYTISRASIDEAYLDLGPEATWPTATAEAERVQRIVAEAADGITCSLGVAPNRLVAKVASDVRKPGGITIVPPQDVQRFLDPLPASRIPGIGPAARQSLEDLGIHSIADLRSQPPGILEAHFGSRGAWMREAAHGRGGTIVDPRRERHRSISHERTFFQDVSRPSHVMAALRRLVGYLDRDMRRHEYWHRTVAVKLRYADFTTVTRQASLPHHEPDVEGARALVPRLVAPLLQEGRNVRLVGVRVSDLVRRPGQRFLDAFTA